VEWNGIILSGETAQTYQTLQAGSYDVIMTDPYGCVATDNMTVTVLPTINAQFSSPNTAQINTPVSFTDLTAPAPNTWNWNFGDGKPQCFYSKSGLYVHRSGYASCVSDCRQRNLCRYCHTHY
jgi:PKD repeat protein